MRPECVNCPWLDGQKGQCLRTPPRFCSIDDSNKTPSIRPADGNAARQDSGTITEHVTITPRTAAA